jgi:lysozyme family protein
MNIFLKRNNEEMKENFDSAFDAIVNVEAGYLSPERAKEIGDSGGETNHGISKRQYPDEDIKNMTLDRAKFLYKRDYWDMCKCDQLPSPLDLFVFDAAVNQGVNAAIKTLQKTLGVAQDGIFGKDTMYKALGAGKNVCALYMADRAVRYTGTRGADKFLRGWMKRLFVIAMEV